MYGLYGLYVSHDLFVLRDVFFVAMICIVCLCRMVGTMDTCMIRIMCTCLCCMICMCNVACMFLSFDWCVRSVIRSITFHSPAVTVIRSSLLWLSLMFSRDNRRRPTVFDLFPDVGDSGPSDVGDAPAGARESIKSEAGRLKGLVAKFLDRGEDSNSSHNINVNATPVGDEIRPL